MTGFGGGALKMVPAWTEVVWPVYVGRVGPSAPTTTLSHPALHPGSRWAPGTHRGLLPPTPMSFQLLNSSLLSFLSSLILHKGLTVIVSFSFLSLAFFPLSLSLSLSRLVPGSRVSSRSKTTKNCIISPRPDNSKSIPPLSQTAFPYSPPPTCITSKIKTAKLLP